MSTEIENQIIDNVEITELSDREHVRKRKGMYLPNINYCVFEIVDNSVDEHSAGYGDTIYVKIDEDRTIYVQDIGRGLPMGPSKKDPNKTQAEVALTSLRAGGKFNTETSYKGKTGGTNGVGASVVNMLSQFFSAIITKDGYKYRLDCEKGVVTNSLYELGPIEEGESPHGTLIMLQPDEEIWKDDDDLDLTAINDRMKQLTYLNPGLTIIVDFNYGGRVIQETYCNPEGLTAYVEKISDKRNLLTPIWQSSTTIDDVDVDFAIAYTDVYSESILVFTNNIANNNGGSHLTGFKEGIHKAIDAYYTENSDNKTKLKITSDDTREGLIAILSIKVTEANYDGQGKGRLNMPKVRSAVRKATEEYLEEMMDKDPDTSKIILAKVLDAYRAREAAKKARDNSRKTKSLVEGGLPGKIASCRSKNPEECEIWLVEGRA